MRVLARSKKEAKAVQQQHMARLWLAGYSHDDIAERVGVVKQSLSNFLQGAKNGQTPDSSTDLDRITKSLGWKVDADHVFALAGQRPTVDEFDVPVYDVWKVKASVNAVRHPGQTDQLFTDRLVYLYTEPGEMVIVRLYSVRGGGSCITGEDLYRVKLENFSNLGSCITREDPVSRRWRARAYCSYFRFPRTLASRWLTSRTSTTEWL